MIIRNPDQRIAVLVDVQNIYYSGKNLYNSRVNFKNILRLMVQWRKLTRAIAYVINDPDNAGNADFFEAIHDSGFEVKEKDVQNFWTSKKGDWDVGIAMDAVRFGPKVDSVILISGDGDYIPVITYLQQTFGCQVEVLAFEKTTNKKLIETADDYLKIDDYKKDLLFKIRK